MIKPFKLSVSKKTLNEIYKKVKKYPWTDIENLKGWEQDVTGIRALEDLPAGARGYLDRVSELIQRPVAVVSVGPDREQTMFTPDFPLGD